MHTSSRHARRFSRAVLAASLVGALTTGAATAAASVRTAATAPAESPITVDVRFSGPPPAGVTGLVATVVCSNLASTPRRQTRTARFGTEGGRAVLRFPLARSSTNGGSNCEFWAQATGTANLHQGAASFVVGGSVRPATATPVRGRPRSNVYQVAPIPVDRATSAAITFTFPSIEVTNVVIGDEPVPGFAYPFAIGCSTDGIRVAPASPRFDGTFTLTARAPGNTRAFGIDDFPNLSPSSLCEVRQTAVQGASVSYRSSNGTRPGTTTPAAALPGVLVDGIPRSALTRADAQTVTVVNRFEGELFVSASVQGGGIVELSVACDRGPKAFLVLRDGQAKRYSAVPAGATCAVVATGPDDLAARYSDTGGADRTDGRVTVGVRTPDSAAPARVVVRAVPRSAA